MLQITFDSSNFLLFVSFQLAGQIEMPHLTGDVEDLAPPRNSKWTDLLSIPRNRILIKFLVFEEKVSKKCIQKN